MTNIVAHASAFTWADATQLATTIALFVFVAWLGLRR